MQLKIPRWILHGFIQLPPVGYLAAVQCWEHDKKTFYLKSMVYKKWLSAAHDLYMLLEKLWRLKQHTQGPQPRAVKSGQMLEFSSRRKWMSISVQGSPSISRRASSTTDSPNHQDRAFILIHSMLGHMTDGMLKRKSGRGREKALSARKPSTTTVQTVRPFNR